MLKVGLTGGIGSGKSEVSRRLAGYGALIIDADQVAREVVEPHTPGLAQVVGVFGTGVLAEDGTLDRQKLGEIVFYDAELRAKLNAIVHPLVGERIRQLEQGADPGAILVEAIPLIAENQLAGLFDLVIVVDVPPRIQEDRLVRDRGMTREQVAARVAAQASREDRLAIADIVLDNSGSLAELDREVGDLWAELCRRANAAQDQPPIAAPRGTFCQTREIQWAGEAGLVPGGGSIVRPVSDLQRRVAPFEVVTDMVPSGDQPRAIAEMERRVTSGDRDTVLLGATGTGKTATVAWLAERVQRPVLVMLPNKTLAAQFANELREMLPHNAVEYFVSYYDYYQPEAYIPQTDTYIEKDSSINDEVERLRHSATNSLLTRRDTIVVASVSCIYGLGTPQEYVDRMVPLRVGDTIERDTLLRRLVGMQYARNDLSFTRGTFRVRGDTIEIIPVYEELAVRIEMFGDEIERLMTLHPLTGEVISEDEELYIFPASHYVAGPQRMERAIAGHRGRAGRAAGGAGEGGQAAGGAAAADAHHLRHRDAAPGGQLLGHRELLAAHRRPRGRAARRTPCSTTSPRTSSWSSTSRTTPSRRSGRCTRVTCRGSGPWSSTGSGCPARSTTGRSPGTSSASGSARPCTCPPPPAPTSCSGWAATWSSR